MTTERQPMNYRKLFTPTEVDDIIARYETGESVAALAERFGCHREVIEKRLIGHGVAMRKNGRLTMQRDARRYWLTEKAEALFGEAS